MNSPEGLDLDYYAYYSPLQWTPAALCRSTLPDDYYYEPNGVRACS